MKNSLQNLKLNKLIISKLNLNLIYAGHRGTDDPATCLPGGTLDHHCHTKDNCSSACGQTILQ